MASDVPDWTPSVILPGQPYDFSNLSRPAAGTRATVSAGGIAGQILVIDTIVASMRDAVGAADAEQLQVWNGPEGTGTLLFVTDLAITAVADDIDRYSEAGLHISSDPGSSVNVVIEAAGVNQRQRLFVAGYFRPSP